MSARLQEFGYTFHCITSLSKCESAQKLRTQNLKKLFGETAFSKFIYLDTGADKDEVLAIYKDSGCIWVEDKIENAETGNNLGLRTFMIEHAYNMNHDNRYYNSKELEASI